ncbi:hypothetical protein B0H17DRAFT_1138313 [Mycena rosella]|uniref:Uncharacterized protein n=1 Tax=Mycena rosella TaxID=1033263 RepID=A0AAD7G9R2_MYCRO|nr:hypothetical protein B0H17DRAFT_1138313 [Mycena rosella]
MPGGQSAQTQGRNTQVFGVPCLGKDPNQWEGELRAAWLYSGVAWVSECGFLMCPDLDRRVILWIACKSTTYAYMGCSIEFYVPRMCCNECGLVMAVYGNVSKSCVPQMCHNECGLVVAMCGNVSRLVVVVYINASNVASWCCEIWMHTDLLLLYPLCCIGQA